MNISIFQKFTNYCNIYITPLSASSLPMHFIRFLSLACLFVVFQTARHDILVATIMLFYDMLFRSTKVRTKQEEQKKLTRKEAGENPHGDCSETSL